MLVCRYVGSRRERLQCFIVREETGCEVFTRLSDVVFNKQDRENRVKDCMQCVCFYALAIRSVRDASSVRLPFKQRLNTQKVTNERL